MPLRAWKILPAVAAGLIAASAAVAAPPVASFGNWLIFYTPENNTYFMRGLGADPTSYFDLQCQPEKGAALLMVPVWGPNYQPLQVAQMSIFAWSDGSEAKEVPLLISKGMVGIALNSIAHPDNAVPRFISALTAAEKYFAFSYNAQTFEFDAKYLPVARLKFSELCLSLQGR